MIKLKLGLLTLVIFLLLDLIWIGTMRNFYFSEMDPLVRKSGNEWSPIWVSALLVYFFITAGLVYFVYPFVEEKSFLFAFLWGAFFGFILYGVYSATNYSLLSDYSLKLALIDVAWGAFAAGMTTLLVQVITTQLWMTD